MNGTLLTYVRNLIADAAVQRLARNTGWLFAAEVIATLVSIVQFPLVARLLGVEGFGTLHLVLSWVGLVGALLTVQVRETVIKYLSEFDGAGDELRALAVVKLTYGIEIVLAVLVFAFIAVTADLAETWIVKLPAAADLIRLEALHLLLTTTSTASTSILRVYDRFRWLSAFNALSALATFGLIVGALLSGWGVAGYILALLVVSSGQTLALYVASQRELRGQHGLRWWQADLGVLRPKRRELSVMLFSMNLDALRKIAANNLDTIVLGVYSGPHSVGLYRLAKQLAMYVNRLSNPLYTALYPELARTYFAEGVARVRQIIARLTGGLFVGVSIIIAGALLLARPIVPPIFGAEYIQALPLFYILTFTHVWLIFIWAPGLLLTLGKARQLTTINVISSVTLIVSLLLLVPTWSALGAAVSFIVSTLVGTGCHLFYITHLPEFGFMRRSDITG